MTTKFPLKDRIAKYARWEGDCLVWHGHRDQKNGYGVTCIKLDGDAVAKNRRVHRLVVEEAYGPIPEGMIVMHSCDNPSCVNLAHLSIGTHQDNALDRERKLRRPRRAGMIDNNGERNPRAKLTAFEVADIRRRHVKGATRGPGSTKSLADEYGVVRTQIQRIVRGLAWL